MKKFTLPTPLRTRLQKKRDELAALLSVADQANQALPQLMANAASLEAEILQQERSLEFSDTAGFERLALAKARLEATRKQIDRTAEAGEASEARWMAAFENAQPMFGVAEDLIIERHIERLTALFLPYYTDAQSARNRGARGTDFIQQYLSFKINPWSTFFSNEVARSVIGMFDQLLAGEEPWLFRGAGGNAAC